MASTTTVAVFTSALQEELADLARHDLLSLVRMCWLESKDESALSGREKSSVYGSEGQEQRERA